jgi:hypothetical protein
LAGSAARERPGQPDELRDFADFFFKRFAGEFLAHFGLHKTGNFNLCLLSTFVEAGPQITSAP